MCRRCYIYTVYNCELREGKQHCQKHTPEFLRETIRLCRQVTNEPLLVRLDSGNDAAENIGILIEAGCYFIIKRNLRKENKEEWLSMVQSCSQDVTSPREGKTVYIGSDWKPVNYKTEDTEKSIVLRTVIGNLVMMASHITEHARQLCIDLGRSNPWRYAFSEVYTAFADFRI